VTAEMYDRVNAQADVVASPPDGLLCHCAGEVDGEWQIVDVWESREDAERFDEQRLGPALEKVLGVRPPAPPPSTGYELHRVIRP
jgi:hypothetical protein